MRIFTSRPRALLEREGDMNTIYDAAEIPLPFRQFIREENLERHRSRFQNSSDRWESIWEEKKGMVTLDDLRDQLNPPWKKPDGEEAGFTHPTASIARS